MIVDFSGGKRTSYYCLADEVDGLCSAYQVTTDEVFFFPEYRNDTIRDKQERRFNWSSKARDAHRCRTASRRSEITCAVNQVDRIEDKSWVLEEQGRNRVVSESNIQVKATEAHAIPTNTIEIFTALHKLAGGLEVLSNEECEAAIQQFKVSQDINY